MPKYIRTKDEILKALDTDYMCGVKVYHTEKGMITEKLVVKQAENLFELCDGVIYYDCDLECMQNTWLKGKNVANFKRYFDYVKTGHIKDVKGAILTDKGLIYVAKMNEKGELVLI